jgi:hypothetical protein
MSVQIENKKISTKSVEQARRKREKYSNCKLSTKKFRRGGRPVWVQTKRKRKSDHTGIYMWSI